MGRLLHCPGIIGVSDEAIVSYVGFKDCSRRSLHLLSTIGEVGNVRDDGPSSFLCSILDNSGRLGRLRSVVR